ncbi:DUF1376 domain-containing protein [Sinorhizobium meliloti]|uniref:DUF1376 domain-containing protein n=1 Tax=Rhizobium meliloti TaxID=382 RepID=A0AAW9TR30_RHIML|nr:DUF1376 domain-containing protein [Sinorhizobium meliloti]MQW35051.1 DUF1376 domain-containing protein [Sinorhizobium meliloti]RVL87476.1 DUF1376 domain-containing protein [Sinorhizobium meliloti]
MTDHLDVRCFPYMPLQIEQLRKSKTWLRCRRRPELGFHLMNLWMRAWHEVPAGSIEDDDDILADAAMCPPEKWEELRDILLEGWERRDGRVYHRTVTDLATEAVTKLRGNQKRTEAARRAAEARRQSTVPAPDTHVVTESVTDPVTEAVTETVTVPEGKGREGKLKEEPTGSSKKRGSRLSPDWSLPDEWRAYAVEKGLPSGRIDLEAEKFKNHWLQQSGQRGVKADWYAAWRNWVLNSLEFGKLARPATSERYRDENGDLTNEYLFGRG